MYFELNQGLVRTGAHLNRLVYDDRVDIPAGYPDIQSMQDPLEPGDVRWVPTEWDYHTPYQTLTVITRIGIYGIT